MDGYVIQLIPDDSDSPIYWTETDAAVNDLNQANLYLDLPAARLQAGQVQSSYTSYTVEVVPASKGIVLRNVAASPTSPPVSPV